jgi:hypothetical protein
MDIHFISTLTPDDEDEYAPAVLNAVKTLLDLMPIAYTIRIETANGRVFHHTKSEIGQPGSDDSPEVAGPVFVPGRIAFTP